MHCTEYWLLLWTEQRGQSVCLLITFVSPAKTAEPIVMPFWELTQVGPRNHVLHEVQTPKGNGQFWGLSTPLKSTDSLRCSVFKNS